MCSVFSLLAWKKDQILQLTFAHGTRMCSSEFTGVQCYKLKQPWQMEKQLGKAKYKKSIKTNCKILPLGKNNQLWKQRMRNLFSNTSEKYLGTAHSAVVNNILLKKEKNTPGCMLSCPWYADYVKWIVHQLELELAELHLYPCAVGFKLIGGSNKSRQAGEKVKNKWIKKLGSLVEESLGRRRPWQKFSHWFREESSSKGKKIIYP